MCIQTARTRIIHFLEMLLYQDRTLERAFLLLLLSVLPLLRVRLMLPFLDANQHFREKVAFQLLP